MKRLFVSSFFATLFCFSFSFTAHAQTAIFTTQSLHAHNDYKQAFPFWEAYQQGYGSIEADIFLCNNQLLVAHEKEEIDSTKTLENLYLQPLSQCIKKGQHKRKLILLIDIKTEAEPTLQILITKLQQFPEIIKEQNVQLTITGNQPDPSFFLQYPSYIWFDANPETVYPTKVYGKLALMSANFKQYSKWNGKGIVTKEELLRLDSVIAKATITATKKIRFWNAPDIPNAWFQLMKLKVGFINTDHIVEAAKFINQLPKNSFHSLEKQATYSPTFVSDGDNRQPKNLILLIADGMGLAHLYAGYTANHGDLTIFKIKNTSLSITASQDSYITDSAPGATAFSAGKKTNNRHVGVDTDGNKLKLLPAYFDSKKKLTAVITAGDITDATPAAFYAHRSERAESIPILEDFFLAPVNILAGSGSKVIDSVLNSRKSENIQVLYSLDKLQYRQNKKIVITDTIASKPFAKGRGEWLSNAFNKIVQPFSQHKDGFMMMLEAAQVDYGGHANDLPYVVSEVLDFDRLVADVLKYADRDKQTLVIITADHETGGLTLVDGDRNKGYVSGHFSTTDHTAVPVPVFAYGPMSHLFNGVYENTEIFHRIIVAMGMRK